jgi:hypothetical protein
VLEVLEIEISLELFASPSLISRAVFLAMGICFNMIVWRQSEDIRVVIHSVIHKLFLFLKYKPFFSSGMHCASLDLSTNKLQMINGRDDY